MILRILPAMSTMREPVTITRVINPCALIEVAGRAVLTDPYFDHHWFVPMNEPIGLRADQLPALAAILGGHRVFDHWQPRSLRGCPNRSTTPVLVASAGMARRARRAGFDQVEVIGWHETRGLGEGLTVECLPGERSGGMTTNAYLLTTPTVSVYVATEARHLEPITAFAASRQVDIAVLPIDGLRFAGRRLVMNAREALTAALTLGARTLVPIHYSQRSIPGLLACTSGIDELLRLAGDADDVRVLHAPAGTPIRVE
jgi:L-ascorbate metabolism protein UlaG (beta-lactamase superfamily)